MRAFDQILRVIRPRPAFTLVFIHIPKTAGMSLQEVLRREARGRKVFWIVDPVKDVEWLKSIPTSERERFAVVEGHMYYGVHEHLPRPSVYLTMLRDPVERVLSYYSHIREREDHVFHGVVKEGLSLGECIRHGLTTEFDNLMVRMLGGQAHAHVPFGGVTRGMLDEARGHLEGIDLLGITERFEESMARFGAALGWRGRSLPRVNVTGARLRREELSAADLELVSETNALDAELYRNALELFEAQAGREIKITPRSRCSSPGCAGRCSTPHRAGASLPRGS